MLETVDEVERLVGAWRRFLSGSVRAYPAIDTWRQEIDQQFSPNTRGPLFSDYAWSVGDGILIVCRKRPPIREIYAGYVAGIPTPLWILRHCHGVLH